jgi:hypothetical protein
MADIVTRLLKDAGEDITMENYVNFNWLDGDVDPEDVEGLYEAAEAVVDAQGLAEEPGIEIVTELYVTEVMREAARRRNQARRR